MAKGTAVILLFFIISTSAVLVKADDAAPIPATKGALEGWFSANVKPVAESKGLDPALVAAETGPAKVIKVMKDGSGDFKTVQEAIDSVPAGNSKRVIIIIGGGEYIQKVKIVRTKPFITLYGSPKAPPTLSFSGTAAEFGTVDSASVIVESDYFVAANIIFKNSSPKPDGVRKGAQAAALRASGNKAAFYNVRLLGFQDTLCDDRGFHLFKDSYIEGTVDFIFGSGTSLYLNTELHVLGDSTEPTVITAQARETADTTGYSFVHCKITGTAKDAILGRAWQSSPRVVFSYTDMAATVVSPLGWSSNNKPERESTVFFGEYKNIGGGASPAGRVKFSKQLTDEQAKPFLNLGYIKGSSWLLPPPSPQV
ncbi:pectinesterase PPME1-like [Humulus lupulus]|uniref:pectinesterase PPME1-like n=1 Tax=Humulus lupulus TaxID=3486 RepID=UPI002B4123FD|nr:pectinesterase PPME1-like [Humulus lupulus]XP_062076103.1 pectinesterase PPME1-like [Humulus lupulus]